MYTNETENILTPYNICSIDVRMDFVKRTLPHVLLVVVQRMLGLVVGPAPPLLTSW